MPVKLCGAEIAGRRQCLDQSGHTGKHSPTPTKAWTNLADKDKKKLVKAGFATPRGGAKGGYQNHVTRSSKVIIPCMRLDDVDLNNYQRGYSIQLLPNQYFGTFPKRNPAIPGWVEVGKNAFVLYRTDQSLSDFPPEDVGWEPRGLIRDGKPVSRRGTGVEDVGHYIIRIRNRSDGKVQGIFAPEYADPDTNFLSQALLAQLIARTLNYPGPGPSEHLQAILSGHEWAAEDRLVRDDICDDAGHVTCPLCRRPLKYSELHEMIDPGAYLGLANAATQVEGSTRSTLVNLFHLRPLLYAPTIGHTPDNVAWGHAHCNTVLAQRRCISLAECETGGAALTNPKGEVVGYMSEDSRMIRSHGGAAWIQVVSPDEAARSLVDEIPEESLEAEDEAAE